MNKLVEYIVKFDGAAFTTFGSLKEARDYVKKIPTQIAIKDMPEEVQIVKSTTTFKVLNTYSPKPSVVLCATNSFDNVNLA